jgi:aromatic-L-amino-acid/L-tryptophan decarboxylase
MKDKKSQALVNASLELPAEEMQRIGYQVVDMIVEHFTTLKDQPPVKKMDWRSMDWLIQEPVPEKPTPIEDILHHVKEDIFKNSAFTTHPRFYSFVPSPNNYISAIADGLASAFNLFSGAWMSSPAAAKLEMVTINWMLKLFGFPVREGGGLFVSGGSAANLMGLSIARKQKLNNNLEGAVVYYSEQTHSSVDKALVVLGFHPEQIRHIPSDDNFQLPIAALEQAIKADLAKGLKPFCVVGNAGTTNTGTVDPLYKMSVLCRQYGLWMHVDAAYGGGSILSEKGHQALNGIELADSITVDPHKWFFQPYEIGCLLVRNHLLMNNTFQMLPEYLRDLEGTSEEPNFYDYGIQLTRGFRALKFYMSIKAFGLSSFRAAVEHGVQLAETVEDKLHQDENWEIISPAQLAVINFRYNPTKYSLSEDRIDDLNQYISQRIQEEGYAMLATTILKNKKTLRMCLINPRIQTDDIEETFSRLQKYAQEFLDK